MANVPDLARGTGMVERAELPESGLPALVRSRTILSVTLVYLLACYFLFLVVDVFDVLGSRELLGRDDGMPLWFHLFGEAMPTEWLQWSWLASTSIVAAMAASRAFSVSRAQIARFLLLLSVAGALMLIEDAGNVSHQQAQLLQQITGESDLARVGGRLPVFVVIAAVPTYALIRYWSALREYPYSHRLFLAGYGIYGLAAFSSVPANLAFDFYDRAGGWVVDTLLGGRLVPVEDYWGIDGDATRLVFMDFVYEESLELIAAGLLLAAALSLYGTLRAARDIGPTPVEAVGPVRTAEGRRSHERGSGADVQRPSEAARRGMMSWTRGWQGF
jgi:hypothetical protein